jgi:hypothetical protein
MRAIILSALAAAAVAFGQTYNLKGRVLEKAGMKPVPGATVKLAGGSLTAVTDAEGRFTLQGATSSLPGGLRGDMAAPYARGGALFVSALAAGQPIRVEVFGLAGARLETREIAADRQGWNRLDVLPSEGRGFSGFAKVTSAGATWVIRVLRMDGAAPLDWAAEARPAASAGTAPGTGGAALGKAAAGNLEVSCPKLTSRTVAFYQDNADVGDIVLDYPPRKLDVGATAPYGAVMLFDGTQGKAAAQAELKAKWKDWIPGVTGSELSKYTAARDQFRIMKDPEFPNDTNRATLQSCCNQLWGYDDIQAVQAHGDAQLHVEFIGMGQYDNDENPNANDAIDESPRKPGYYNSGVYLQSRYEVQVRAFSQDHNTLPGNHDIAALVDDYAPSANANRPNGKWQAFDITFRSARYDNAGRKLEDARVTLYWNGVKVHDNRVAHGPATGIGPDQHSGEPLGPTPFGLKLQSEGSDVRYRNIWIKDLNLPTADTNVGY